MFDPETLIELAHEPAQSQADYLQAKAVLARFDKGERSKIGQIIAANRGGVKRAWEERKLDAYASPEFEEYINARMDTELLMDHFKVEYETAVAKFEAYQSALSYQRDSLKRNV